MQSEGEVNNTSSPRTRVTRACNACRRRKVKCDGHQHQPCRNCSELGLQCTYSALNQSNRSRQSIVRGRIIAACKSDDVGGNAQIRNTAADVVRTPKGPLQYPISFFWGVVDDYCTYTLPTVPIIGKEEFRCLVRDTYQSTSNTALVYCLAAQTIALRRGRSGVCTVDTDNAGRLFELALQVRGPVLALSQITLHSVLVSVLVSMGMFATDRDAGMGSYYNREAVAGIQALKIDDASHQASFRPEVAAERERMFWLVFVHDRFHSLSTSRLGTLEPLPNLPAPTAGIPDDINAWFEQIVLLFKIVDNDFLRFYANKDSPYLTLEWIEEKQSQLGDDKYMWIEHSQHFTDMQHVDLVITRCWLRTLVWQIALHKFALTSDPQSQDRNFMSLDYPIRLSHQLRHLLTTKSREAVEVHGTGLLQKIFEIACTVADLLQHVVPRTHNLQAWSSHLDCFLFLHTFLFNMSKFYAVERNILNAKLIEVRSVFPDITYDLQFSPLPEE